MATQLLNHSGNEALTIGEHIKLFFSELSTSIDAFNAEKFNSSIHMVKTHNVFEELIKKDKYFEFSGNQIPTPVFFNPNSLTFREYTSICLSAIGLLDVANDELVRAYKAIKECAVKGQLSFSIRHWSHKTTIDEIKRKLDLVFENTGKTTRAINQVYPNLTIAKELFEYYNNTVKNLKSRDVEIVSKRVEDYIEILKILKRKIDANDIKLTQDDLLTIELLTNRLNDLVSMAGRLLVLLNGLARELELQATAFKHYTK